MVRMTGWSRLWVRVERTRVRMPASPAAWRQISSNIAGVAWGEEENVTSRPPRPGEAGGQEPIVALVEVETGLLAGAQGHREAALAFLDDQIAAGQVGLGRGLADRVEALDARRRRIVEAHDPAVREDRGERLSD